MKEQYPDIAISQVVNDLGGAWLAVVIKEDTLKAIEKKRIALNGPVANFLGMSLDKNWGWACWVDILGECIEPQYTTDDLKTRYRAMYLCEGAYIDEESTAELLLVGARISLEGYRISLDNLEEEQNDG